MKKIISITELSRNTKEVLKSVKNKDFVVVKNNKPIFYGINPSNYKETKDITNSYNASDYLSRLARQTFKENIYFLMRFESPNITFPEIDYLMNFNDVVNYDFEVKVTKNLIDAWKKILYSKEKITLDFIINLNAIIAKDQALKIGQLRDQKVYVGGTNYIPSIPNKNEVINDINKILSHEPEKAALEFIAYGIRNQLFFDGNKRTSILIANKILKDNGIGLLAIKDSDMLKFNKLLQEFYDDENKKEALISFLSTLIYNSPDYTYKRFK